jgi:hypothetical protein
MKSKTAERVVVMKEYKYEVTFKDDTKKVITVEAESVLDGHYRIYREYFRNYKKSCYMG